MEKHPWCANQWQARLQDVPVADHGLVLFMQATRWADDIRMRDKQHHRGCGMTSIGRLSRMANLRSVQTRELEQVNILTALAENERILQNETDPERNAIAMAWLFHLVGDVHQPLHTAQLFTVEYPQGDKRNEICVRRAKPANRWTAQVLGWSDYVKLEFDTVTKREHFAPKLARVSAE
jgi:hypothetical protein